MERWAQMSDGRGLGCEQEGRRAERTKLSCVCTHACALTRTRLHWCLVPSSVLTYVDSCAHHLG